MGRVAPRPRTFRTRDPRYPPPLPTFVPHCEKQAVECGGRDSEHPVAPAVRTQGGRALHLRRLADAPKRLTTVHTHIHTHDGGVNHAGRSGAVQGEEASRPGDTWTLPLGGAGDPTSYLPVTSQSALPREVSPPLSRLTPNLLSVEIVI